MGGKEIDRRTDEETYHNGGKEIDRRTDEETYHNGGKERETEGLTRKHIIMGSKE